MFSKKYSHIVLGALATLTIIATFAVLLRKSSSVTDKLPHGPVPVGVSQDEVARTGRAAEVLVTEEQVRLEKLAVSSDAAAETPTIPAPTREQLFEAKHSGRSAADLIEARKGIEAELSQKTTQILKDMIQRGDCELLVQELGKPIDTQSTPGWAVRTQSQAIGSPFEEVKLARICVATHPDTSDLYAEALWIGGRVDQMGGRTAATITR